MGQQGAKFGCPQCGKEHRWKPEYAGKRAKCACGRIITVPNEPIPEPEPLGLDADALPIADGSSPAEGCPSCGAALGAGAVLCVSCGYNVQTGQHAGTAVESASGPAAAGTRGRSMPVPHRARISEVTTAEETISSWKGWGSLLFGLVLIVFAVYEYNDLTEFEEHGGARRLQRVLWLAYQIGGKWGVVILLGGLGIGTIFFGILRIKGKIASED